MRQRWGMFLLLSLSLMVTGCVRTAGTPYEPVDVDSTGPTSTTAPVLTATPETPTPAVTSVAQAADTTPTETDVPITVIPPTETPLPILESTSTPTDEPTDEPTEDTGPSADDIIANATSTAFAAQSAMADPTATPGDDAELATQPPPTAEGGLPSGPSGPVDVATIPPTVTPTATPGAEAALATPPPEDANGADTEIGDLDETGENCTYTVRVGDNAFRIAVNNNITLAELRDANPDELAGQNPIIQPGDVLDIPGCGRGTAAEAPPTEAPDEEAPDAATTDEPDDEETVEVPEGFIEVTVRSGDTLLAIARRYATTVDELVEVNNLTNPDVLDVGQNLLVPDPNAE